MVRASLSILVAVALAVATFPAQAGLVGFWEFDGNLTDSSGLGNNGTFSGGTASYGPDRFGTAGSAIVTPGTAVSGTNYANVTVGTAGRPSNTFSFGGWVKTTEAHEIDPQSNSGYGGTGGQKYAFGAPNQSANAGAGLSVGINGLSVYEHGTSYMPALAVYNPGGTAAIGTGWNHIMVVYQDRVPTIYLNGVLVQTGVQSAKDIVYAPYQIGGGSYGGLVGSMDAVGVWNHALTVSEIAELAGRPIVGNGSFEWDTYAANSGYASGNGGKISGWQLSNSAGMGLNPANDGASDPSPFANNGLVPDGSQVAFIQAITTPRSMEQTVVGMEPGEHYVLTYRENARSQTGRPSASVTLDDQTIIKAHTVAPVEASGARTIPYRYVGSGILTAASETAELRFSAVRATANDDASLLLDNIQILPAHLM
ncbi:MAG: LamG-like jellyroll fold domain-containing protein, partial [Patescibacteria group bacterium]|nr:LamG-like jellyroll fold domain-containing protein [Patescibacteria group bacterium]